MPGENDVQLVYDDECPVCSYYSRKVDVADGKLSTINAREQNALIDEITEAGYDLDEGMILKVGNDLFHGSDAIRELALLSSHKGGFNRAVSRVFRNPGVARVLYPLLSACRRALLWLLGRPRIDAQRHKRS